MHSQAHVSISLVFPGRHNYFLAKAAWRWRPLFPWLLPQRRALGYCALLRVTPCFTQRWSQWLQKNFYPQSHVATRAAEWWVLHNILPTPVLFVKSTSFSTIVLYLCKTYYKSLMHAVHTLFAALTFPLRTSTLRYTLCFSCACELEVVAPERSCKAQTPIPLATAMAGQRH